MRVLVTGATGFVGMYLVRALVAKKYTVCVLVRKKARSFFPAGVEEIIGDITILEDVVHAVNGCSVVFHLAAVVSFKKSDRVLVERVNVGGTENVIHAVLTQKTSRLIYVSSASVIGLPRRKNEVMNEDEPFVRAGNEGYPESKWLGEELVREACRKKKLDAVVVCPSAVYGAGGAGASHGSIVSSIPKMKIIIAPPGGCSIVTVDDTVNAILLAFKNGQSGEKYIITGENISYKTLFERIYVAINGKKPTILLVPSITFYPVYYCLCIVESIVDKFSFLPSLLTSQVVYFLFHYRYLDNSKAKNELGWIPKNDFVNAFREMYTWR